ncbi:unnamed protein product [Penicillium glandicola]
MDGPEKALGASSDEIQFDTESAMTITGDETPGKESPNPKGNDWSMMAKLQEDNDRNLASGFRKQELGITWKDLSVQVISSEAAVNETVLSQFNIPTKIKEGRRKLPLRTILNKSHGCVKPGEMLLVLGRPGSGCTTLLKMLANRRGGYTSVEGDIRFGSMQSEEAEMFRGQIVMNTEEEIFFPSLTVGQTMDFATRLKVPFHLPEGMTASEYQQASKKFLLESVGISHTEDTKVGNEYVRGVSGGERKRVSIVECMATRASVFCWDQSTRGLDASTALEWTKAIRAMTDTLNLSTVVTLYQAGNGIYDLFDKVLVLDEGEQIFYGTREQARPFMEEAGFICREGSNIADYLTGVTVPTERRIRDGFENRFPRNAEALRAQYERSPIYTQMAAEYSYPDSELARERTEEFKRGVAFETSKNLPKNSPFTIGFVDQVKICVQRQYQILWGDKATFIIKQVATLCQALIAGSLFYNAPDNSGGLFIKSGALFFSLLYNSLLAMSEVNESFSGRPVLVKHKSFAYFHPAAFCLAQIAADIPVLFVQISMFGIVLYFMVGLSMSAGAFFSYWIIVFTTTMTMTALFRAVGALFSTFDGASKISGLFIMSTVLYTGYMIPKPTMHPWLGWIFWIDPLAYGFEALLSIEFHDKSVIPCVGTNLIPTGIGYEDVEGYQSCAGVAGAIQGQNFVVGDNYLASFSYSYSHVWRNLGINWVWWALFVFVTIIATSRWKSPSEAGSTLVIPREYLHKHIKNQQKDEEGQTSDKKVSESTDEAPKLNNQLVRNTSVFTWKNLSYTVQTPTGDRLLLDNVHGWVKPGMLGALMGSSGAGKTTLLDVLAQRKTEGTINGSVMVDGRPLPVSFQRSAGYVEQLDIHERMATVRESLEFSALLRQPATTPREEKLAYVDVIIDLLELHDLADTMIGTVGAGLSVEQRKRVTIGVELVSKPSILIFLDEPTSGLDGQSAYNTVRFLRRLADAGQAVLVTVHQPSAQLFAEFDQLLLLAKGGKTVFFGPIGENSQGVKGYFSRYGAPCPPETNPAEHMIDVVSGQLSQGRDWNKVWLESPEHSAILKELDEIIETAASKPQATIDDGREFATTLWEQTGLVLKRTSTALYRNADYINNKFALHISTGLFVGFSFWMIGDSVADLQSVLFFIFNAIFVAPGVINQLQPTFLERRDLFEAREKKAKMYSWKAFTIALVVSEFPYLIICAALFFNCWYWTAGMAVDASKSGSMFFVFFLYEFLYTGIGQFVAAYAPNAQLAAMINPLVIGTMISFCGVLVPYAQIVSFWRYWMYWINPFNYLMGSMLVFGLFDREITCKDQEFAVFDTPNATTCGEYLSEFMQTTGARMNLINPEATEACQVCQYTRGSDYLITVNLMDYFYGWRDTGIVALFVISSYALVFGLMKLRTKASKTAQ